MSNDANVTYEDRSREMLAQSGQSTLNALLVMNGGAVAAFLTFLTPLIEKGQVQPEFVSALTYFIYGLVSVVVAFASIHLCILASKYHRDTLSIVLYLCTAALGIISGSWFISGALSAMRAVQAAKLSP